tara:strand:- start:289 stop:732 length:444 start_codon:yes stop_codon:yes gene_type:complete
VTVGARGVLKMTEEFMIGELAKRAGCKVQTTRYYEQIGVMPTAARANNNRRMYRNSHLKRLMFIRHSRALGFTLDEIRELLALSDQPDHTCAEVDKIAKNNLENIQKKIRVLSIMEKEMKRMIFQCHGEKVSECLIITALADHAIAE